MALHECSAKPWMVPRHSWQADLHRNDRNRVQTRQSSSQCRSYGCANRANAMFWEEVGIAKVQSRNSIWHACAHLDLQQACSGVDCSEGTCSRLLALTEGQQTCLHQAQTHPALLLLPSPAASSRAALKQRNRFLLDIIPMRCVSASEVNRMMEAGDTAQTRLQYIHATRARKDRCQTSDIRRDMERCRDHECLAAALRFLA